MGTRELELHKRDLETADDRSFLRQLRAWLTVLEADTRSSEVLADLRDEYAQALAAHRRQEDLTIARLERIRDRLGMPPQSATRPRLEDLEAPGRAHRLIGLMRTELGTSDELDAIAAAHERRHGDLVGLAHTSCCGSLRRLDWLAEEIDLRSRPVLVLDTQSAIEAAFASVRPLLRAALGDREMTPSEQRQLGHIVVGARADTARVQERLAWRPHRPAPRHRGACR